MKINKELLIVTCVITLLPILAGVAFWDQLPDQVATHWGFSNEPDGWSSKSFAVFGLPLVMVALQLVCALGGRYGHWAGSDKVQKMVLWIIPVTSLLVMATVYGYALGMQISVDRFVLTFMGAMFAVVGNYLPKCRQNPTIGIKLPWTLSDEENWNRTHRFAAPIWVVCGLAILMYGLFGMGHQWIAVAAMFVMIALPMVYSYVLHRKKQNP